MRWAGHYPFDFACILHVSEDGTKKTLFEALDVRKIIQQVVRRLVQQNFDLYDYTPPSDHDGEEEKRRERESSGLYWVNSCVPSPCSCCLFLSSLV